jgi:hypothetical protein
MSSAEQQFSVPLPP